MRTKEIDGFIYKNHIPFAQSNGTGLPFFSEVQASKGEMVKAKLIIELPEKKVELTESQFDEAVTDNPWSVSGNFVKELKDKLFRNQGQT